LHLRLRRLNVGWLALPKFYLIPAPKLVFCRTDPFNRQEHQATQPGIAVEPMPWSTAPWTLIAQKDAISHQNSYLFINDW